MITGQAYTIEGGGFDDDDSSVGGDADRDGAGGEGGAGIGLREGLATMTRAGGLPVGLR
jgi:hypothetical protein